MAPVGTELHLAGVKRAPSLLRPIEIAETGLDTVRRKPVLEIARRTPDGNVQACRQVGEVAQSLALNFDAATVFRLNQNILPSG
jgi:hypothetical protein